MCNASHAESDARRWRCKKLLTDSNMNCFPALIMSASFGLGRFREINTSKTVLRRYRAAETAEAMTSRGRPHGGRLKARIAPRRFIFLTASVSASIIAHYPIQRNKIFILLRWEKELRSARKIAGCDSVISDTGYFGSISPVFMLILGNL